MAILFLEHSGAMEVHIIPKRWVTVQSTAGQAATGSLGLHLPVENKLGADAFHDCRGVIPSPSHGPLWMRKFLHPSWLICGVFNMNGGSEDRNVLPGPRRPTFLIYLRFSMGPSTKGDSMQLLSDLSEARAICERQK